MGRGVHGCMAEGARESGDWRTMGRKAWITLSTPKKFTSLHAPSIVEPHQQSPHPISFHCIWKWSSVWLDHFPEFIEEACDHLHDAPVVVDLEPAESAAARGA
jgi:hypothetical protein